VRAKKLRDLELKAGRKTERGAQTYNIKSHRDQERRRVEQRPRRPLRRLRRLEFASFEAARTGRR
jgi:hypothetical protein